MARLYPTVCASVLCLALIFVHTGESLDCRRTAKEEATLARKLCIQSEAGGCRQAYGDALRNHQRSCSFQVGRRSAGLATLLDDSHSPIASASKQWRNTKEAKFNSLLDRLREAARNVEDDIPEWIREENTADSMLDSQSVVPQDSFQRLFARL
ncbi:uncharacterized protein [Diadema setosum]|uniref:uncharacterized protein n=1 Tax=Diadema setosum TaxID=31175 RepID=UPI003B3A8D75